MSYCVSSVGKPLILSRSRAQPFGAPFLLPLLSPVQSFSAQAFLSALQRRHLSTPPFARASAPARVPEFVLAQPANHTE